MNKALLFDMSAGVSGDMVLGGLFALGLDPEAVNAPLRALGLAASVQVERVILHGLQAARAQVVCEETHPPHRGLRDFLDLLERAPLPPLAKENSGKIFQRLAEAEAEAHGIAVEQVHFHEVGGLDTLVDVMGASLGLLTLGVERCFATPFPFGRGVVSMEHGVFPEPVPATALLTRGFPSFRTGWEGEHCTPTGAAIVTALARPVTSEWTSVLTAVGYGAGTRDPKDRANVLRLCLYEETQAADAAFEVFQIECNLDNATPEQIAFAAERLLEAGCFDAWQEPIVMKKGRAAVKLCALASQEQRERALRIIAAETPSGGLRWFPVRREVAQKQKRQVTTKFGVLDTKEVEFSAWEIRHRGIEYASARRAALETGTPLRSIQEAGQSAAAEGESP